jgi:hypothetical protein
MLIVNSQTPLDEAAWSVYSVVAFGAATTGTIAAYVRARMDQPNPRTVP